VSKKRNEIKSLFIAQSGWPGRVAQREMPMDKEIKQPRKPKDPTPPARPSHDQVAEYVDKWANSPGLQPPK
jgi:hypothetical protein